MVDRAVVVYDRRPALDSMPILMGFQQCSPFAAVFRVIQKCIDQLEIGHADVSPLCRKVFRYLLVLLLCDLHAFIIPDSRLLHGQLGMGNSRLRPRGERAFCPVGTLPLRGEASSFCFRCFPLPPRTEEVAARRPEGSTFPAAAVIPNLPSCRPYFPSMAAPMMPASLPRVASSTRA